MGSGSGPFLNSLSFDMLGSYRPEMIAFVAALLLAAVLLLPLGTYPLAVYAKPTATAALQPAQPAVARSRTWLGKNAAAKRESCIAGAIYSRCHIHGAVSEHRHRERDAESW